ncbi:N-alpha-acetyltransferase 80 [Lampris incognitus]|uniref:N-alpha-acetyltransferase 80 n=1 Tax=Lampris incognitus TaxID=2546036 RepID=UPI0024B56E22|nr:N-alpha-acetyltransferase 80 [Lampris incognitus]
MNPGRHRCEPTTSANSTWETGDKLNRDPCSILTSDPQMEATGKEPVVLTATSHPRAERNDHQLSVAGTEAEGTPCSALTNHTKTDSAGETLERIHAVPIHRRPDLLVPCADLVNSEWQRSQAARVHSLQKSCQEFPVSLILLQGTGEAERLLGHARLSRVIGHVGSLFVESVVVSKAERGKGHGRILMEETERYASRRRFKRLYLTTHDKQHFYAHLGYVLSVPVQNAGAMTTFVPMETLLRFSRMPAADTRTEMRDSQTRGMDGDSGGVCAGMSPPPAGLSPPPLLSPRPSLPKLQSPPPAPSIRSSSNLPPPLPPSSIPSPPPPPPPPPAPSIPLSPTPTHLPPPYSAGQQAPQTLTETPYRDAKGVPIFWMHKDV